MNAPYRNIQSVLLTLLVITYTQSLRAQSPPPVVVLASSDFELGADGWYGTNNLGGSETLSRLSGGATTNSAGYASVNETVGGGGVMYFVAPPKYRGDMRRAYHGSLKFSFKQSATSSFQSGNRFVLLGSSSSVLSFDLPTVPGTAWQNISVPLHEGAGWHVASLDGVATSYQLASREDFLAALRAVNRLWIRAEYSTQNSDRSDLDDVVLLGQPSGPVQPVLAAATYAGIIIDGAVGASYRIEYRGSFDTSDNWHGLTNVVLPNSPYLFINQSSPNATSRYYRTVLNP